MRLALAFLIGFVCGGYLGWNHEKILDNMGKTGTKVAEGLLDNASDAKSKASKTIDSIDRR